MEERPRHTLCPLRFPAPSLTVDVGQVFQPDCTVIVLGFLNEVLADAMVRVGSEACFLTADLLQFPLGTLGLLPLELPTMTMDTNSGLLHLLVGEDLTRAVHGNVNHAHVHAENVIGFDGCVLGHIAGGVEEELAVTIHQIYLTVDAISPACEVGSDIDLVGCSSFQGRETDLREVRTQSLEGQDTSIVGNAAVFPELWLDVLVPLVCLARLADGTDTKLSGETVFVPDVVIDQLLNEELARRFLLKADDSNIVTSGVEGFHCLE